MDMVSLLSLIYSSVMDVHYNLAHEKRNTSVGVNYISARSRTYLKGQQLLALEWIHLGHTPAFLCYSKKSSMKTARKLAVFFPTPNDWFCIILPDNQGKLSHQSIMFTIETGWNPNLDQIIASSSQEIDLSKLIVADTQFRPQSLEAPRQIIG
jgi:hypothetical protein